MNSEIEKIICDDSQNITKWHNENNISLSIVKPPYITDEDLNDEYLTKLQNIIKEIAQVTKKGGICCLILDEDKSTNQKMSSVSSNILEIMESKNLDNWEKHEEIIWVKSPKSSAKSINLMDSGILINFEDTPFSTIHVFQRNGSELEYIDSEERISKLDINDKTKEEWSDSIWFIQPNKESEFQARIPLEILTRLIRIFSDKNNIVLDPFSGFGEIAVTCKKFQRCFLCFELKQSKTIQALNRIKSQLH